MKSKKEGSNKERESFSKKLAKFFNTFCTKGDQSTRKQHQKKVLYKNKHQKKITRSCSRKKVERCGTLILQTDSIFIRISRKNIIDEQFLPKDIINFQIQKHLNSRIIHFCAIALFQGQFTNQTTHNILYPIILTDQINSQSYNSQSIAIHNFPKLRDNTVDVIIYQTTYTRSSFINEQQNDSYLPQQIIIKYAYQQMIEIMQKMNEFAQLGCNSLVVIASNRINSQQLGLRLIPFSKNYLFELERVKKHHNLFCNIIYISKKPQLLRINEKSIQQFIIDSLQVIDDFQKKIIQNFVTELIKQDISETYLQDVFACLKQVTYGKTTKTNISHSKVSCLNKKPTFSSQKQFTISDKSTKSKYQQPPQTKNRMFLIFLYQLANKDACYTKITNKYRNMIKNQYGDQYQQQTPYLLPLTPDFQNHHI